MARHRKTHRRPSSLRRPAAMGKVAVAQGREALSRGWEPVRGIIEGVEQIAAGTWYPARRMLMSGLAGVAGPKMAFWVPEADLEETSGEIMISVALPGVDKSEIRVSVTENSLTVSGRRREAESSMSSGSHELYSGKFLRRIQLPDEVRPESAKALYRDGVLRVTLARARAPAGRHVKVE